VAYLSSDQPGNSIAGIGQFAHLAFCILTFGAILQLYKTPVLERPNDPAEVGTIHDIRAIRPKRPEHMQHRHFLTAEQIRQEDICQPVELVEFLSVVVA
jgi:hypothetical protein